MLAVTAAAGPGGLFPAVFGMYSIERDLGGSGEIMR